MLFTFSIDEMSPAKALVYLVMLGVCCAIGFTCAKAVERGYGRYVKLMVVLVVLTFMTVNLLGRYPDWDEAEHVHGAWLLSQGLLPYRDFWQHHFPTLWVLLAPLMPMLPNSAVACDFARILSLLISGSTWVIAGVLARRVHGQMRGLSYVLALLWAGTIALGEFFILRPDLIANGLTLGAMLVIASPRIRARMLISGLLLGAAVAFNPKYLLFLGMAPLVFISEPLPPFTRFRAILAHYTGAVLGFSPLLFWLGAHHLLHDFYRWAVQFNRNFPLVIGGSYSSLPVLIFLIWVVRKRIYRWREASLEARMIVIGTILGAAILFIYPAKYLYHAQMFLILAAVAGVREICELFTKLVADKRAWICGALTGLYLLSYPKQATWIMGHDYLDGRREIAVLNRITRQETVVCTPPRHPLLARNATDISQPWQWYGYLQFPQVQERLQGIDEQIMTSHPAVIFYGGAVTTAGGPESPIYADRHFFAHQLRAIGVLDAARTERLIAYLEEHYTLMRLVRNEYWVRNDLVEFVRSP